MLSTITKVYLNQCLFSDGHLMTVLEPLVVFIFLVKENGFDGREKISCIHANQVF